jgi:hypothetical protein
MDQASVCIIGACRDIEPYIYSVLNNITTICSWWGSSQVVIFENDSKDATSAILRDWISLCDNRILVQESNLDAVYPLRTARLAYIRNKLLKYVTPSFDYMLIIDMDDIFTWPVKKESFDSCFYFENWDVITANSNYCKTWHRNGYYDIWALRVPNVIDFDCWDNHTMLLHRGYTYEVALQKLVIKYMDFMNMIKVPINVNSAFNGAIICKVSFILPCCQFVGLEPTHDNGMVCEHISFQNCLRSHGARIVYNPEFII